MRMRQGITLVLLVIAPGCSRSHGPCDISSLSVAGPATIAEGTTSDYTVTLTRSSVCPHATTGTVRLYDEDTPPIDFDDWLSESPFGIAVGERTASVVLKLSCRTGTIWGTGTASGGSPDSGEGNRNAFGSDNPAEVYAGAGSVRSS